MNGKGGNSPIEKQVKIFNWRKLRHDLSVYLQANNLTQIEAARRMHMAKSQLGRFLNADRKDALNVESLAKLVSWLGSVTTCDIREYIPAYAEWTSANGFGNRNASMFNLGPKTIATLVKLYDGSRHGMTRAELWGENPASAAVSCMPRLEKFGLAVEGEKIRLTERGRHVAEMFWELNGGDND